MAPKHLTRKEIVHGDRIGAALTGIYGWSARNKNLLTAVLVSIFLATLGSYLWQTYQGRRSGELQTRFAEALEIYHPPAGEASSGEPAEKPDLSQTKSTQGREQALEKFRALANEYPDRKLGQLAQYYVALTQRELEQKQEAKTILDSLIQTSTHSEIKNLARNLRAFIAQSENDYPQAAALWEEILQDESAGSFPKQAILYQLAHACEAAGKDEDALRYYRRLTAEYPSSEYSQEARLRIDQVQAQTGSISQN